MISLSELPEAYERFIDSRLSREGMTFGNAAALLVNGGQAYPAMLEAIASARQRIDLLIYIFRPDATGWRFADALAERARRGVRVRVAFDSIGCWGLGREHFRHLRRAGAEVHRINPILPRRMSHVWYPIFRDHRKILVVDDRTAFLGGMNIGDEYDGQAQDTLHWRDYAVRLAGPAALYLRRLIDSTHLDCWGRMPRPLPGQEDQGGDGVIAWFQSPEPFDPRRIVQKTFGALIGDAQRHVWIMSAYFAPNWPLLASLARAVRRGVDVRLVLPGNSDIPVLRWVGQRWYEHLLAGGIRIYERDNTVLHAKAVVADDAISLLGSSNLDARSLYLNREILASLFDRDFARQLAESFQDDFARSRQIQLPLVRRRRLLTRLREHVAYMLSPAL